MKTRFINNIVFAVSMFFAVSATVMSANAAEIQTPVESMTGPAPEYVEFYDCYEIRDVLLPGTQNIVRIDGYSVTEISAPAGYQLNNTFKGSIFDSLVSFHTTQDGVIVELSFAQDDASVGSAICRYDLHVGDSLDLTALDGQKMTISVEQGSTITGYQVYVTRTTAGTPDMPGAITRTALLMERYC